jgi:hypothetical protein
VFDIYLFLYPEMSWSVLIDCLGLFGVEWLSLRLVWSRLAFEHFSDEVFIGVEENPLS